ncbi:hypothetical protein E4U52_006417 [Claviceps spartinae]|nr:hypothetical protein E4U52_006417 [Claviceps spartinae]
MPRYRVTPVELGVPGDAITLDEAKLLLGDFGVTFRLGGQLQKRMQEPRRDKETWILDEDDLDALHRLLRCILPWEPSKRPDISKVLRSEWMTAHEVGFASAYEKALEGSLEKNLDSRWDIASPPPPSELSDG